MITVLFEPNRMPPSYFWRRLNIGKYRDQCPDKDNATLTPEDQKETKKDIKITAHIRKNRG